MTSGCTELSDGPVGLPLAVHGDAEGIGRSLFATVAAEADGTSADDAVPSLSASAVAAGGGDRKPCAVSSSRMRSADMKGCRNMMSRVTCATTCLFATYRNFDASSASACGPSEAGLAPQ